jgi:capsular exopolysaccharide synthesis family protein
MQETDVENLQVICAGPVPPNPAELLASNSFDHLLEQLEARADVVIFDTPPCMPVTDPTILASRMDGVLLVLNPGKTRKPQMAHVLELLGRARARVVGVVLNRVEVTKGGYYYNYYGGYYAETANEGSRQRRNGGNGKGRTAKLPAGSTVELAARDLTDDELN